MDDRPEQREVNVMAWIRDLRNSSMEECFDKLIAWRSACHAVDVTYREWASASVDERPFAFERYRAALELEEERATSYAALAIPRRRPSLSFG
jgi:hypothetical protein